MQKNSEIADLKKIINIKNNTIEESILKAQELSDLNFNDIRNNFSVNFSDIYKNLKK